MVEFLGFEMMGSRSARSQKWYPHVEPQPKSLKKLRETIRGKFNRSTMGRALEEVIPELNRTLKGGATTFTMATAHEPLGK